MIQNQPHFSNLNQLKSQNTQSVNGLNSHISLVRSKSVSQPDTTRYQIIHSLLCMDILLFAAMAFLLESFHLAETNVIYLAAMVFFSLSSYCTKLFDMEDSHYVLGKVSCMLVAALCIEVPYLALQSPPLSQVLFVLSGQLALFVLMAICHHYFSRAYSNPKPGSFYYRAEMALKKVLDVAIAVLGLVIASPLMALVSVLVWLEDRGAIFFGQTRVGLAEEQFKMLKFRSMYTDSESIASKSSTTDDTKQPSLFKMKDDPRITKIGKIIRKLSIDEVPQLVNVLMGEMSIVGPRPPLPYEFGQMNRVHRMKFRVKPGITGYWQVTGRVRNERGFNEVSFYDNYYIDSWCLIEDLRIILATVPVVIFQKGAY